MKVGIDNFSLRFNDWDAFQVLDYCHPFGLEVLHLSDLGPFKSLDAGYLDEVKAHAGQQQIA